MTREEKIALIEEKEAQIMAILKEGNLTFKMAKSIIQRVGCKIMNEGDTFLNNSAFKDVSPSSDN